MSEDILALVYLVMLRAAQDAEADLKAIMDEVRQRNERLCHWRKLIAELESHRPSGGAPDVELVRSARAVIAGELTGLSEMSETMQLRLQMAMDRRSKSFETLSNLMKKQSDTAAAIVGNLK